MKILYVTTVSMTMNYFLAPHIQMLQDAGHTVELACNQAELLSDRIMALHCKTYDIPFSRSPLSKDNLAAYQALKTVLKDGAYDVVHTHTPTASALVRLACRKLRSRGTKVVYTAHGFHFFDGAPKANWMIYYPVELLCSRWTDVQITITEEDYQRASEKLHAVKTAYIPGVGVDLENFGPGEGWKPGDRRRELSIPADAKLLLSVGELNENKNHRVVLEALRCLQDPQVYYVVCGEGRLRSALEETIREYGLSGRVFLLGQRSDVPQWMAEADIYVHPSLREGLSVSTMEAMASGLPVVCGDIRGNRDLIQNDVGGLLFAPADAQMLAESLRTLLADQNLRTEMGTHNRTAVQAFSRTRVLSDLKHIYEEIA